MVHDDDAVPGDGPDAADATDPPTGDADAVELTPEDGADDPVGPDAEVTGAPEQLDPAAAAEAQRDEYLDALRRERAEFENFRRRAARSQDEARDKGRESLMSSLLGVLDNFAYTVAAAESDTDPAKLAKGVTMVHAELLARLADEGLEIVPGVGSPFDPEVHEAVQQVPPPEGTEPPTEPTVASVLRAGYRYRGTLLRPASVTVVVAQ